MLFRSTFVADVAGAYVAQLIVNDGKVNSAPDTVTISTQNSTPVANAGPAQTVLVGQTVTLDGSKSSDVDGDPLTYLWALITKPAGSTAALSNPTAVHPTFVADVAGAYVAQLIVNDGKVNSAPATVTVTAPVTSDTTPPVIGPVSDITVKATSPAGAVVTYQLPSVTDNLDPAPTVSASPPSGSTFPLGVTTVTVTARDAAGNISTKTFTVSVWTSVPPTFTSLTASPASPQPAGTALNLTASVTGGTAPQSCKWFWTTDPTWATYSVLHTWQACTIGVPWTPSAAATDQLGVWARSAGSSTDAPEASAGLGYEIVGKW